MRKGNVEFCYSDCNKAYQLVYWQESAPLFVIAFFRKDKEGYNMETVGNRFFRDHNAWVVAKHALAFLNDIFEAEEAE